jgi:hypothetical protein
MARRERFVRVRLVPSHLGNATQVKLTEDEYEAIVKGAQELRLELSTFLRELGVAAAQDHHAQAARDVTGDLFKLTVIERAADEAHMTVSEWLRVIAVHALGIGQLGAQMSHALAARVAGLPHADAAEDHDSEPPPVKTRKRKT